MPLSIKRSTGGDEDVDMVMIQGFVLLLPAFQAGKQTADYDGYEAQAKIFSAFMGLRKIPILGKCSLVPGPDFHLNLSFSP